MKAFLFDVDDTLYNQIQPFERAYEKLFGQKHTEIEKIFAVSRRYSDEVFEDAMKGKITLEQSHIYRIQRALKDFDIEISDEKALKFQEFYQYFQMHIGLSQTMVELLEKCVEKHDLGVITNGPSNHQWNKVHALGIERWIPKEHIIVSGDCEFTKPDRRIFDLALERMGFDRENCYFVGDSIENDMVGAANANWKSIWMNRRNKENHSGVTPDYIVHTEEELKELILSL